MSSTASTDTMGLAERVQSLPRELFDIIHDYVFHVAEEDARIITAEYKPPSIVQVDRRSR